MSIIGKIQSIKIIMTASLLMGIGGVYSGGVAFAAPATVDLRDNQTPIRSQGNRRSCITFSSTAALEAAYKRAGYGELDLSEQFFQYMNKMFWLHQWRDQQSKQAADQETQLGFSAGGSGSDYLGPLANGFRIPEETVWPYRSRDFTARDHPAIANKYNSPYWSKQKTKSDFNLEGGFLKKKHLTAARYYSGTGFNRISGRNKDTMIRAIENQLSARREVVIDMNMQYRISNSDNRDKRMLERCDTCTNRGAHSMLIVGYNRVSRDSTKHYFIVKNSWGINHNTTRTDGYTFITYDMLKATAYSAAYITGVTNPRPWPELANIGRWETKLGAWRGILDIYHVPGVMKQPFTNQGSSMRDARIGTFYNHKGKAYRVNGVMSGRKMTFWIDKNKPHVSYDRMIGTKYTMNRIHGEDLTVGRFTDNGSVTYAGYMKRKGTSAFREPTVKRDQSPRDIVGKWAMVYGTNAQRTAEFCITSVSSSGTIRGRGATAITGSFKPGEGGRHFRIRGINNNNGYIDAIRMSWHGNIATGESYWDNGRSRGGVLLKKIGTRCTN
ncbi:MAG: hypothetical protein COA43_01700 [Robiginitomaculum sp.]|nr:MAG: hypothetical protein COA43_01700 [Robiginitomaculum sp.]